MNKDTEEGSVVEGQAEEPLPAVWYFCCLSSKPARLVRDQVSCLGMVGRKMQNPRTFSQSKDKQAVKI